MAKLRELLRYHEARQGLPNHEVRVATGIWYDLWLQEIGCQEEAALQLKVQELVTKLQPVRKRARSESLSLSLSPLLPSAFLLAITLAKTEDKEAQLMEYIKVNLLVLRGGQKKKKKKKNGGEGSERATLCWVLYVHDVFKAVLLWG